MHQQAGKKFLKIATKKERKGLYRSKSKTKKEGTGQEQNQKTRLGFVNLI